MKPVRLLALTLLCWATPGLGAMELPLASGRVDIPVSSIKGLRFAATVRQQFDFSCGSAAIATLLTHHYGRAVTEKQVFEQMYLHGDQAKIRKEGFSMLDMQRFLASLGYRADGFELPLQTTVNAQIPAIVLVAEKGYQHFIVVKGGTAERILIGDPAGGTRAMPRSQFEAIWRNKLLFVIHGKEHRAAFNRLEDWRTAPHFPLAEALSRDGIAGLSLSKLGPGDF